MTEKSQEGAQDLQPCYHQGITRVSAAPPGAAGVTCDRGRRATARGGPSKGLTRRRGDFAIVNSWDGRWERGKQSALSGLAVAPERLSWHQSSVSERPLMDVFLSHAVSVHIHAKQQTLWWKTRVWRWE